MIKPGGSKIIVGYDLGNTCSQISYFSAQSSQVETVSAAGGSGLYSIPTVLCKLYGSNQWLFGREALKAAEADEGILVENLLEMAIDGEPLHIEGTVYDPAALLTLYIKRSLGLLAPVGPAERIGALMLTCEYLDNTVADMLKDVMDGVKLRARHICFQSYEDSFYQYMVHQPEDLHFYQAVLCWYDKDRIKVYRMQNNRRAVPVAVYMEKEEFPFYDEKDLPEYENLRRERLERMDREFLELAKKVCDGRLISSVYLIGEGFGEEWMKESLRYLCRGRRVFLGNNLYSKGACLGMMERLKPSNTGKRYVLLGNDKLKTNVELLVDCRGERSSCMILEAGCSWYEARADYEFYLQDTDSFELVLTPVNGRKGKIAQITLEGLNYPVSRLLLQIDMPTEEKLAVTVEDLGFGEFRPASHQVWTEEISVYD